MNRIIIRRFFLILTYGCFFAITSTAQLKSIGDEIKDVSYTDIHGNSFSLYEYLDQGYTVFIDISATWCAPCWAFHQAGTMQDIYSKYGPDGSVDPGKMLPIFIEGDPGTTREDLNGTGTNTRGNWVDGKGYPIVEIKNGAELLPYYMPGSGVSFPTFLMICPDRKVIYTQIGFDASKTAEDFFNISTDCESVPTSILGRSKEERVRLHPNPVKNKLYLNFASEASGAAIIQISTISGEVVYRQTHNVNPDVRQHIINTSNLVAGMYLLRIDTGGGDVVFKKMIKQ